MNIDLLINNQHEQLRFYIACYIKQKRISRGLLPAEVAVFLKISQNIYSRIESGKVKLTRNLLESLIYFLELDENEIFEIYTIACIARTNAIAQLYNADEALTHSGDLI